MYCSAWHQWNPCGPAAAYESLSPLLRPEANVLDIGCGRGETLAHLAASTNWHLWGIDPDTASLFVGLPTHVTVLSAQAEALPFPDGFFDAAIMECVFSLCRGREAAAEAARVLAHGGRLLVTDLYSTTGISRCFQGDGLVRRIYTEPELLALFFSAGFALRARHDGSQAMRAMFGQMILDGTACCLSVKERQILRECRVGYGLWELELP